MHLHRTLFQGFILSIALCTYAVAGVPNPLNAPALGPQDNVVTFDSQPNQAKNSGLSSTLISGAAQKSNNLSDLTSVQTALQNLNVEKTTTVNNVNYTILSTDKTIFSTGSGFTAPRTLTLPLAASVNSGREIVICDQASAIGPTNTWTITPQGSDVIRGGSVVLNQARECAVARVYGTGSAWVVSPVKTMPTGDIAGTSDTQTFTNKSISGTTNSFTNLPAAQLTGTAPPSTVPIGDALQVNAGGTAIESSFCCSKFTTVIGTTLAASSVVCGEAFEATGGALAITLPVTPKNGCTVGFAPSRNGTMTIDPNGSSILGTGTGAHNNILWALASEKEHTYVYLQYRGSNWYVMFCDPLLCENSMPTNGPMLVNGQGQLAPVGSYVNLYRYKGLGWFALDGYPQRLLSSPLRLFNSNGISGGNPEYIYLGTSESGTISSVANNGGIPRITISGCGHAGASDNIGIVIHSVLGSTYIDGQVLGVVASVGPPCTVDLPGLSYDVAHLYTSGGLARISYLYASTVAPVTGVDGNEVEGTGGVLSGVGVLVGRCFLTLFTVNSCQSWYNGADLINGAVAYSSDGWARQAAASDLSNGASGTGSVCLTANCAMTTPNLGTPSAVNLTNATSIPAGQLTGTVPSAALPTPTASTLGGVKSKFPAAHLFLNSIDTSGLPTAAQPVCNDIFDAGTACTKGQPKSPMMGGTTAAQAAATTSYYPCEGQTTIAVGSLVQMNQPLPFTTTLKSLSAFVNTAPGTGQSDTFTLMKNGTSSGVTCTISNTNTTCNDNVNSASFAQNDLCTIQAVTSATAASTRLSFGIESDSP